jgi:hypothetical protein
LKQAEYSALIAKIEDQFDEVSVWLAHVELGLSETLDSLAELKALKDLTDMALATRTVADLTRAAEVRQACSVFKPRQPLF